ncbi:MAG TPA: sigma-70 family RNA polymerase sigma factor [Ktedonobacterales bacterium]
MGEELALHPLSSASFADSLSHLQGALIGFVCGLVGDAEQARDVVQDAFVDAWRANQRGVPPFVEGADENDIRRWLFQAAYHRTISVLRRRRVIAWESLDLLEPREPDGLYEPAPFEDLVAEGELLREVLGSLGPKDSACLLLNVVQGFTAQEIAHMVNIEPEAAKKRVSRAKQRLRNAYFAQQTAASGTSAKERPLP